MFVNKTSFSLIRKLEIPHIYKFDPGKQRSTKVILWSNQHYNIVDPGYRGQSKFNSELMPRYCLIFFKEMQDQCNFARTPPWDQNHQTITIYGYAKFPYNTKLSKAPYTVFRKMSLAMGDKCIPSSEDRDGHNNLRSGYLIYPLPPNFLAIVAAKLFNFFLTFHCLVIVGISPFISG